MKRSKTLRLTTLMAAAGFTASACGQSPVGQWDDSSVAQKDPVPALAYQTLQSCKQADEVPDAECQKAYDAAVKDDAKRAPRYADRAACEEAHGEAACAPRQHGSFFTPLLAGFVIGRLMSGGSQGYSATGLYRDRRHDGYTTGFGGRLGRDYRTGGLTIDRSAVAPPSALRQQTPPTLTRRDVVSRGGFGGRARSYGG